jgi:hypothetical protein
MTLPNEVIILGGGTSIQEGINSGLKNQIKDKFTILTNYSFKYFEGTFLCFMDRDFYKPRPDVKNPDIYKELKKQPLIVGINHSGVEEFKLNNTILLPKNKFYDGNLTGIFALSLACHLLDDNGWVYLVGFDWSRQPIPEDKSKYNPNSNLQIHYYNDISHRGVGWTGYYDRHNADKSFLPFMNKKDIKIYNVSLQSNIEIFEKISYSKMFDLLSQKTFNQTLLRQEIKNKLIL